MSFARQKLTAIGANDPLTYTICFKGAFLLLLILSTLTVALTEGDKDGGFVSEFPSPAFSFSLNRTRGYAIDKRTTAREINEARRRLGGKLDRSEVTPLFRGMGTHYSHLWVGTPPQRVSVIVDTGSHHTAFPCVGCKCGVHIDPYFDPKKSSTSKVQVCSAKKCFFRQAYSEGSSWNAFKVSDKVWVGSDALTNNNTKHDWNIDFSFGCQDSETGLFRTQKVDGIMGMSASDSTLPFQLVSQGVTKSKVFAMCFRVGGGLMTLGGVDTSIHAVENSILFARLTKTRGWFTVVLQDIMMRDPKTGKTTSIGGDKSKFNSAKGTIVDSGTTDTYLPRSVASNFKKLYKSISGMDFVNTAVALTLQQYDKLPILVYRMEGYAEPGKRAGTIEIECPPSSYMEAMSKSSATQKKFSNRVYLTEVTGVVLGANFMNDHNVIFDVEGAKIGFAKSTCQGGSQTALKTQHQEKKKSQSILQMFNNLRGSDTSSVTTPTSTSTSTSTSTDPMPTSPIVNVTTGGTS